MSGQTSSRLLYAIKLLQTGGMSAYAAAQKAGIALSTIYRSKEYRQMRGLAARNLKEKLK